MSLQTIFENSIKKDCVESFLELYDRCKKDWKISNNILHEKIAETYEFQKSYLDKYPENVVELKKFGYHKDLVNDPEYAWLFDQESNGFFGLK